MKNLKILIIAILLIITAAISAGCSGTEKQTTPAADNTPQATQITAGETTVPTETTGPQAEGELKQGDKVNATDVVGNNFSWYEYRINRSSEMPPNGIIYRISTRKTERSMSEYEGTPAIHFKSSYHAEYGFDQVADNYYDTSMNNFLGGGFTSTREGEMPYTEEVPANNNINRDMSNFFKKDALLTYLGTESITVPEGIFPNAKKYTIYYSESDVVYTYWFAPDVPIPVQIQCPNNDIVGYNGFESRELTGWG